MINVSTMFRLCPNPAQPKYRYLIKSYVVFIYQLILTLSFHILVLNRGKWQPFIEGSPLKSMAKETKLAIIKNLSKFGLANLNPHLKRFRFFFFVKFYRVHSKI